MRNISEYPESQFKSGETKYAFTDYQISHTIFCSYCSRDTLMNWSEDKIYPFRPYHDENCYKPHDPNRYFAFFEQEGRFNVTVDHIWKNEKRLNMFVAITVIVIRHTLYL